MDIFESAFQGLSVFAKSIKAPKSFADGKKFEDYIRDVIFPIDLYKLLNKTHDYYQNSNDYVESSKNPDFELQPHGSKWRFHVECKYRDFTSNYEAIDKIYEDNKFYGKNLSKEESQLVNQLTKKFSYVELCTEDQLIRYKKINQANDVLIALGLYDLNSEEIKVFLIPVCDLTVHYLHLFSLDDYVVANNHFATPAVAYNLLHGNKSYCIRCRKNIETGHTQSMCYDCWKKWYQFKKFTYLENYCAECGKESKTSISKPICIECYKAMPY